MGVCATILKLLQEMETRHNALSISGLLTSDVGQISQRSQHRLDNNSAFTVAQSSNLKTTNSGHRSSHVESWLKQKTKHSHYLHNSNLTKRSMAEYTNVNIKRNTAKRKKSGSDNEHTQQNPQPKKVFLADKLTYVFVKFG